MWTDRIKNHNTCYNNLNSVGAAYEQNSKEQT